MVDKVPGDIAPGIASRGSKIHATQDDNSLSRSHLEENISRLQSAVNDYDALLTYNEGDLVLESGVVFRNINDITVPESFTPSNWQAISSPINDSQWKEPVLLASTEDIDLTGVVNVDGQDTATDDRILVKDQDILAENGIYIANDGSGWSRASDMDVSGEFDSSTVWVKEGTVNVDTQWYQTNEVTTVNTSDVEFEKTSSLRVAFLDESNTYDSGLTQDLNDSSIVNASNIGIGTDEMTGFELHISDMAESGVAQFRMTGFGGTVTQNMGQEFDWQYRRSTSGIAIMDIMLIPLDNGLNSNAVMRFGLNSGSTGNNNFQFFNSNGNQVQSQLGSSNSPTFFNSHGGFTSIGKRVANFQLDVNGNIRTTENFIIDSGGVKADGTVTINSPDLSTFAEGTVTLSGVTGATHSVGTITHPTDIAFGDTVTIGPDTFEAGDGTGGTFNVSGTPAQDQANLIALINSVSTTVEAKTFDSTTIDITAITLDATTGDAIALSETGNSMSVSGTNLTGGVDVTDEVTLNGLQYSPVTNPLPITPNEGEFDVSGTDDEAAIALDDAINADTRVGNTGDLSSTVLTDTVTVITNVVGVAGNSITMSENTTGSIVVSGTNLTGGLDGGDTVTLYSNLVYTAVNGIKADNTQFDGSGTDTDTATDLADSINNDTRQGSPAVQVNVDATSLSAVVTLTASVTGTVGQGVSLASSDSGVAGRLETSGANLGAGAGTDGVDADQLSIASGTLSADTIVSFPDLTDDDKFALLGVAQTFTGAQSFGILDYTDAIDTIASGELTPTVTYQSVAGEGAAADDLVTITAGTTGQNLIIRPSDGAVTITVKNTGNIVTIGGIDFVMNDIEDTMTLIYDGANWIELSRNSTDTESFAWPLTDEVTPISTGTKYTTEPAPYDMTINEAIAGLTTAGTGAVQATGTATLLNVVATNSLTLNGLTYTGVGATPDNTEFLIGASDTDTATNLATAITNDTRTGTTVPESVDTAISAGTLVTITAGVFGAIGNIIDLTENSGNMTLSGSTLGSGAGDFLTIDILKETAVNSNGFATIFSTLLTVNEDEYTSTSAPFQPVLSTTTWEKGRRLELEVITVDTDIASRGAKATLVVNRS